MAKAITKEQSYALFIMVAHLLGIQVDMLTEAESIIKEKKSLEPSICLWFERSAIAAHNQVAGRGIDFVNKANAELAKIRNKYL